MDSFKKLVLLSALLALASCNETISPELQQGGVVTPPGGGTTPEAEYSFKITNLAPSKLNYLLHKTGSGNKEAKCEITSESVPFSKATYRPNHDITCFLEAEEHALYQDGLSISIEASPKTCEFVKYRPFSYYNRIPGDSSGNYTIVKCESYTGPAPAQGPCNSTTSTTITSPVSFPIPLDDSELCRFNYNDKEMCDIGIINITEFIYSSVDDGAGGVTHNVTSSPRRLQCGGKPRNCAQGPYAVDSNGGKDFSPNGGIIYSTDFDNEFTKELTYPSLMNRYGNFIYANYRRNLANYTISYGEDDDSVPYKQAFANIRDFHPQLITEYALDGQSFLAHHGVTVPDNEMNRYSAKPLAAEPFMGLYSTTPPFRFDYTVQPFYTFECLDNAKEVKARIRLMVRDWDRIRSNDPNLASDVELISDIFRIPEGYVLDRDLSGNYYPWSRQDNFTTDPDSDIPGRDSLNNYADWDDIIQMRYITPMIGSKGYIPTAGFFTPSIFPNEQLED